MKNPMKYIVVGILASCADAEAAVADLERVGIVGEQVEVFSDIDKDVRTANTPGEASTKPRLSARSRIAHLFGAGGPLEEPEVRALDGEMPNYIGRQSNPPAVPPRYCMTMVRGRDVKMVLLSAALIQSKKYAGTMTCAAGTLKPRPCP
jgi:hypothetical protein